MIGPPPAVAATATRPILDQGLEEALRSIAAGTAGSVGDQFFRALVSGLVSALDVELSFVAEFSGIGTRVKTLAFWDGEHFVDNKEFDTASTPCRDVIKGSFTHYPEGVYRLFPCDPYTERGIESYLGLPLEDDTGQVLGHLVVMDTSPFGTDPRTLAVLEIFAARAAAELARKRTEEQLRSVLDSAMDAIVTVDEERRVVMMNRGAGRVFRVDAAGRTGQCLDPLLSREFADFLTRYIADARVPGTEARQCWAPGGLSARRADGSAFPAEATLSPMDVGGRKFVTLILRDMEERERDRSTIDRLRREREYLQTELSGGSDDSPVPGRSEALREAMEQLRSVAPTDSTVLITGETGTGKELACRTVHQMSRRREHIMVKLNCAALPGDLVESELFGHDKGAFTGATRAKPGRFELADGGTIFLDEVGELTPEAQAKLLRVLQEREVERVGGTRPIRVDVRVVAASNRPLEEMVASGQFRADLFYRLNVFPVRMPALRHRADDIPELVQHFVARNARALGKHLNGVTDPCLARLRAYHWPGNVRELQNVIERASILSPGPLIGEEHVLLPALSRDDNPGEDRLESVERAHVTRILERCGGRIEGAGGAAEVLGLAPSTLRSLMKRLGISRAPT